jgi:hypothetical protein
MKAVSPPNSRQYVWPPLLLRPPPPPVLVYLDMNHWIGLAKAATGHPDGACHHKVLAHCHTARTAGIALFPLSSTHYMEMGNIRDPRQRRDIAQVMEELSGFAALQPRDIVFRHELDAVLTMRVGPSPTPLLPLPLIRRGCAGAFGLRGGFRVRGPDGDITESVRQQMGPDRFDAIMADAELRLERSVLAGPTDDEVERLRALGWNPEATRQIAENRAVEERAQAARLNADPRWRRGRLRDVVMAREVIIELFDALSEALQARGCDLSAVWTGRAAAREIVNAMPSSDVAVTLKTAAHKNPDKSWLPNDIYDIDALSVAVPYCDIVITEKHAHHVLQAERVPSRTGTVLLRRLADLTRHLPPGAEAAQHHRVGPGLPTEEQ